MDRRPGQDGGTGDAPGARLPGGRQAFGPAAERTVGAPLTGFARDGAWDACPPSAALAAALEAASGPDRHCPGATRDELLGMLRQWQAMESWAAAGKLALLRALIRDDDQPVTGGGYHGDLPDGWSKSLTHEVALALSMPAVSADHLMWLAWNLQAVLPGTGALLERGQLTLAKARTVDQALTLLSGEDAAMAEAMILPEFPGKTYSQVQKLAAQAAIIVDPESAARRRHEAEQHRSRVAMSREDSGASALSGRDLPTDQTLAAYASLSTRAQAYKDSGVFPDDTRMDQYRAVAYLDLINGTTAETRIATGHLAAIGPPGDDEVAPDLDSSGDDTPTGDPTAPAPPAPPRLADLVLPLATLLGLTERPGEAHGLGPLDPDLCRELASAAASSPWTQFCVTVTDQHGIAIGHGCARPHHGDKRNPVSLPVLGLPARANLTIPAARLAELAAVAANSPPGQPPWSFRPDSNPGPPGNFGTWTLTLPGGSSLTLHLIQVPTFDCDHRHESHAYQPNDTLRHLVQIRDGTCTFPPCSRHARESDFEHAVPYDKGGRTCACNAGARSRACHQIKQSSGWTVTQPKPGWHQWTTPSGRTYTQAPKRYPA
jgi:hypothetical protein